MSTATAVHLAMPCPYPPRHDRVCAGPVPCSGIDLCRPRRWKRTDDPEKVTCSRCLNSPQFPVVKP